MSEHVHVSWPGRADRQRVRRLPRPDRLLHRQRARRGRLHGRPRPPRHLQPLPGALRPPAHGEVDRGPVLHRGRPRRAPPAGAGPDPRGPDQDHRGLTAVGTIPHASYGDGGRVLTAAGSAWLLTASVGRSFGRPAARRTGSAAATAAAGDVRRQQLGRHRDRGRRPHPQGDQADQHHPGPSRGAARDLRGARPARVLPRDPAGGRRGPRPVRRRHVHHPRRQPGGGVPAELLRRGVDRPGHRQGRGRAADERLPHRPHERLADGLRLLVSDSTDRSVHEYVMGGKDDPATGTELRTFESGDTPHESNYSKNGKRIFHASIGRVYTPIDYPELGPVPVGGVHDTVKADRWFEIVDNQSFKVKRRWDMGKELAEAGFANMSSAVRPMAITPGREDRVPPGLVLPRHRGVQAPQEGPHRRRRLQHRGTAGARHGQGQAADPAAHQRRGGRAVARGLRPRLGAPRHRHQQARHAALRRGHDVGLRRHRQPEERALQGVRRSRRSSWRTASTPSPTGRPPARSTATAGCRWRAATWSWSSTTASAG